VREKNTHSFTRSFTNKSDDETSFVETFQESDCQTLGDAVLNEDSIKLVVKTAKRVSYLLLWNKSYTVYDAAGMQPLALEA
jgi:predicted nucleotide-binding protein (sugar kinase/HSP70/actin superfamily)